MKYFIPVLILIFIGRFSQAGEFDERRNYLQQVGKVLDCGAGSLELLDLYEARQQYGRQIHFPAESMDAKQRLGQVLARLENIHPRRQQWYQAFAETLLWPNIKWLRGVDLHQIDAKTALPPRHCQQATLLRIELLSNPHKNKADQPPFLVEFFIDQDLWERLDSNNQLALWLHALIALEGALLEDILDPVPARMYTGLLLSTKLSQMSEEEFADFIDAIGFTSFFDW